MHRMLFRLLVLAPTAAAVPLLGNSGDGAAPHIDAPAESRDTSLLAAIREAAAATGGVVGVHLRHLESGRATGVNEGEPFFMSSVTKVPISVRLLRQVQRGWLRLEDSVRITREQMAPGHSPIRDASPAGVTRTLEQLLRAAVRQSDNSASDALLRLAGGPDSVNAELARLGIRGIRVSRPYQVLGKEMGDRADAADTRDTSTPAAMTQLLAALQAGRLLGPTETRLLLGWMTDTENPPDRIVAGLPAGTGVAHKTGTWGRAAMNDVGIITLPGGRGHLALAVFIRNPAVPDSVNARAIAAITRAVWERAAGRGAGVAIGRSPSAERARLFDVWRRAGPATR